MGQTKQGVKEQTRQLAGIKPESPVSFINILVAFHINETAQPKIDRATTVKEWDTWSSPVDKPTDEGVKPIVSSQMMVKVSQIILLL